MGTKPRGLSASEVLGPPISLTAHSGASAAPELGQTIDTLSSALMLLQEEKLTLLSYVAIHLA